MLRATKARTQKSAKEILIEIKNPDKIGDRDAINRVLEKVMTSAIEGTKHFEALEKETFLIVKKDLPCVYCNEKSLTNSGVGGNKNNDHWRNIQLKCSKCNKKSRLIPALEKHEQFKKILANFEKDKKTIKDKIHKVGGIDMVFEEVETDMKGSDSEFVDSELDHMSDESEYVEAEESQDKALEERLYSEDSGPEKPQVAGLEREQAKDKGLEEPLYSEDSGPEKPQVTGPHGENETAILLKSLSKQIEELIAENKALRKQHEADLELFREENKSLRMQLIQLSKRVETKNPPVQEEHWADEAVVIEPHAERIANVEPGKPKQTKGTSTWAEKVVESITPQQQKDLDKKRIKKLAASIFKKKEAPLEFTRIHCKIEKSEAIKKAVDKTKLIWQMTKEMNVHRDVIAVSKIGNSIIELYVKKHKMDMVREKIKAKLGIEILDNLDLMEQSPHNKEGFNYNELTIKRLQYLYRKAALQNLKTCIVSGLSEEMAAFVAAPRL